MFFQEFRNWGSICSDTLGVSFTAANIKFLVDTHLTTIIELLCCLSHWYLYESDADCSDIFCKQCQHCILYITSNVSHRVNSQLKNWTLCIAVIDQYHEYYKFLFGLATWMNAVEQFRLKTVWAKHSSTIWSARCSLLWLLQPAADCQPSAPDRSRTAVNAAWDWDYQGIATLQCCR